MGLILFAKFTGLLDLENHFRLRAVESWQKGRTISGSAPGKKIL
jgi:hypothetical protein